MEMNDPASLLFKWWPQIEANKNRIFTGTAIVGAVILGYSFYSWHHTQTQIDAGEAMTQALISIQPGTEPGQVASRYLAISDDYSGTLSGQRALMQGAAALFMAGKYADAQGLFQRYGDAHPDGEFSGQAALGVAKCQEAQGKLDAAAGTYQHVISDLADEEAVIAAEFALAEINLGQKKYDSARQLFQKVMDADRFGALGSEAAQYLYSMQSLAPAPAAAPAKGTTAPFNLSH
jgi:predicted negative regulator of RcsB-dependent stress response